MEIRRCDLFQTLIYSQYNEDNDDEDDADDDGEDDDEWRPGWSQIQQWNKKCT